MTIRWEQRVAAAVLAQRTAPVGLRVSGGLLLARIRVGRWARRARVGLVAAGAITGAFIAIPVVAVVAFLIHAL